MRDGLCSEIEHSRDLREPTFASRGHALRAAAAVAEDLGNTRETGLSSAAPRSPALVRIRIGAKSGTVAS